MARTLALASLTATLAAGCVETGACTEMGCLDGLVVSFEPDGLRAPGDWTIALVADGEPITCTVTLPFAEGAEGGCDRQGVFLTLSGTALDPSEHSVPELTFDELAPEVVEIEVSLDGEVLVTETLEPTYDTLQPNGPDCPPVCEFAAEAVAVPQPG